MAEKKKVLRKETVRERATKAQSTRKPRRLRASVSSVKRPLGALGRIGKREYYLPLPESKWGAFLNKRRSFTPRYLREAWQELRGVTWPSRRETWKLTLAVFTFAIVFGLLIAITDYGLDKLFRKVILKV